MSLDAVRWTQIAVGVLALSLLIISPQFLGSRGAGTVEADELVRQLQDLPAWLDPPEARRKGIYVRLHALGSHGIPALTRALSDPNVNLRQNAALALGVLGEGLADPQMTSRVDISAALPALLVAVRDPDTRVRGLSAQAIADIGPGAAAAVPSLIELLASDEEEDRNSACIALHDIGRAARPALPALRRTLADSSPDVRGAAKFAIAGIEGAHFPLLN